MSMLRTIFIPILAIIIANTSFADTGLNMKQIRANYKIASINGGNSIDKALDSIESLPVSDINEKLLVKIYQGSLLTMKARDSWMPWNKLYHLNQGLDLMDEAIDKFEKLQDNNEKLQDNNEKLLLEAIITRAITNAKIPSLFNRSKLARLDFGKALTDKNFTHIDNETKIIIYVYLAIYAEHDDKTDIARQYIKKAEQIDKSLTKVTYNEAKK